MRSGHICRLGAIAGRMACILAVVVLTCVSVAYGQVIEEGGFPVKGGGVSGEPFSLSCPPRLVAHAGESVLLSCSATAAPEEGVRYEWESLSGDGLHLLSDANERSPLFTAPLSGEGAEYVYRLTAMSVGVYETAAVTVIVGGVSGETVSTPVVQEGCDSLADFEGGGRGECLPWNKAPPQDPFGGIPEDEGIVPWPSFPGSPGAEEKEFPVSSGEDSAFQTPPYLDCPVAVFLEELETGSIECHVSDAAGEEFLEYSWESVGGTTRDYLENPKLIPEDAPDPSVVAPEAPVYETLESFRSGERTFRYRYRLTATSRATGLSSSSEVEVFVSGSRPSVYCPLEIVVEEGETITLDCEGADPLSFRMDYNEESASVLWEWEGLWGTSTAPLAGTELSSPLFTAPLGSAGEEYHYIASMTSSASGLPRTARRRVTVKVTGGEEVAQQRIRCSSSREIVLWEGDPDHEFACRLEPNGINVQLISVTWGWTGSIRRLSATNIPDPVFDVPGAGVLDRDQVYTLRLYANYVDTQDRGETWREFQLVVKNRALTVTCDDPSDVNEGSPAFDFSCSATGPPDAPPPYTWSWSPTDNLTDHHTATPTFAVPDDVDGNTTYTYKVTANTTTDGLEDGTAEITVTVKDKPDIVVACASPLPVYEGSDDITFDCAASGAPEGSAYEYAWTARGDTPDTSLLSSVDIASPTFYVPGSVPGNETYEYTLTVSADDTESGFANVTVTVLNKPSLTLVCTPPASVYEGAADFDLDCSASGAPEGSAYEYAWTARGNTANTSLLSSVDIASPTFYVPEELDATTTYEYLVTVSAANAESSSAEVSVTVLNRGALALVCADPGSVYEGREDIALDCSASGAPEGSAYEYAWTARGDTPDTSLLSSVDIASPTFYVPGSVPSNETYEYTLTVSADDTESGFANVTVTVLNKPSLTLVCTPPASVYEGAADFDLDCSASGAPEGSAYEYAWTARGNTANTSLLSSVDIASPTFYVPEELDATTTYEYLVTVSAANAESSSAEVSVTVLNRGALALVCADPGSVYEGREDIALDCSASGAPEGSAYEYAWTARGSTANTLLLSSVDIASPTFYVPEELDATTTYKYLVRVSAANAESSSANVTVMVLNRGALALVCADPGSVYEGREDIALDCSASGAPEGSAYEYAWTARGDTPDTSLLSSVDIASPTFYVPEELDATTTYKYLVRVSAANAESSSANVTVRVLNKPSLTLVCTPPALVYEGAADFDLDCSASGAPEGSAYEYAWTARGDTPDTSLLSSVDIASPTFYVPEELDATTTYKYLVRVSAANAESSSANVTVRVLNKPSLTLVCTPPALVYEGAADFDLDCSASGAPEGSAYEYAWTARGDTPDTSLLSGVDIASPTFYVPEELDATTTYKYRLTVSAENAEDASAEVTVTVLNKGALALVCADPGSVYEGREDIALDCSASGAPEGSAYEYAWTARGDTPDTALLSSVDIASPTFYVPEELDATTTYKYRLTVSAENAEDASAEVTVTVLNKGALALVCADPGSVYEGREDIALDCSASGAPEGSAYEYAWTARGDTPDTALLSSVDIASPTFYVPEELDATTTYEYLVRVSAANAESSSANVTVTVLNRGALALVCADPGSVYEGREDIALDCSASGGPEGSAYEYAWTARGDTPDTALLSATDIASPTFYVPEELDATTTYKYLVTVSAANAESSSANVTVTVLNRIQTPDPEPVSPPLASSSLPESSLPSSLGVTVSTSSLRFGVQSSDTEVSLDPMTDHLSTRVSGPYHAGRMTLSLDGSGEVLESGEMDLSVEIVSPVTLRREGGIEVSLLVLSPRWSYAESCDHLSSQSVGGLYTEVTLSEGACRLLRFGGELGLTDVPSGRYAGSMDVVLRSGKSEETHTVAVDVTVIPAQRVVTIGPGGVRFSTSRELPAGLTEEQNLSIYPDVAFLTEEKPHGVFELSNPSLIPLEVTVSARFGYTEATEDGREVVVEDTLDSRLGDLSQVVDIHPNVLVLQPGEKGLVRYGVQEGALAAMAERGYAAFFDVVSSPRQYVRSDRMLEEVAGDRTARVTMRVPGVYVPGEGASQLRAALSSISFVGSLSATFLLETQDHPFVGEVVAYDGDGRELGRRETLVYTRSHVRVPLDRMPEAGTMFLHFIPRGSDRVPEPGSIEWNAPARDIGDAGNKDGATTTATLVQKP